MSIATQGCLAVGCESSGALPAIMLAIGVLLVLAIAFNTIHKRRRRPSAPESSKPNQPK